VARHSIFFNHNTDISINHHSEFCKSACGTIPHNTENHLLLYLFAKEQAPRDQEIAANPGAKVKCSVRAADYTATEIFMAASLPLV